MIKTIKRILSFTAALAIVASMSTSVYAAGIRRYYGSNNEAWVEASLIRSGEVGATAYTQSNQNVTCNVSLQITCYNKENVNERYTTGNGNSKTYGASVSLAPNTGYYCERATSSHSCSTYGFNESLSA